jgi:signal peptidase I
LPKPKIHRSGLFRDLLETAALVVFIYTLVNLASVRFIVEGPSMQPNFHDGNFLIVSRINYLLGKPDHGDIVVFHYPNNTKEDYIKRIIGVPGDTVEIRDTQVYIDGRLLEEPYINEPCNTSSCRDHIWELGPDEYFVMGDNRNHSSDSRSFGPVNQKYFVGEVIVRYWPPSEWGLISGHAVAGG